MLAQTPPTQCTLQMLSAGEPEADEPEEDEPEADEPEADRVMAERLYESGGKLHTNVFILFSLFFRFSFWKR